MNDSLIIYGLRIGFGLLPSVFDHSCPNENRIRTPSLGFLLFLSEWEPDSDSFSRISAVPVQISKKTPNSIGGEGRHQSLSSSAAPAMPGSVISYGSRIKSSSSSVSTSYFRHSSLIGEPVKMASLAILDTTSYPR